MTYFYDPDQRTPKELLPGVAARTFWGERMLLSLVDLAPGAVIPSHSHPHEQVTTLISGSLEMTIAGETRLVQARGRVRDPRRHRAQRRERPGSHARDRRLLAGAGGV